MYNTSEVAGVTDDTEKTHYVPTCLLYSFESYRFHVAPEGTSVSTWIAQQISALYAKRRAFTEAECSERIRRALRKQLRPTDDRYETGDKVYYKPVDSKGWEGPGVVIGQDGVVIFVRHVGTYVRVHQSRLQRVDNSQAMLKESDDLLVGTESATSEIQ